MGSDMAAKLLDSNGHLKPFRQWLNDVFSISTHYCGAWLRTEYDTAVIRAHNAADWQSFLRNKDVMPNLRWMPTTLPNPESSHRKFWEKKLTLPVNDPFWTKHHPGDRWNCKCSLEQTDDPVNRPDDLDGVDPPQRGLENNPGKDGHTFSDNHPYYPNKCSHCDFYKSSSLKNKVKSIFTNRVKDCYNCPYINGCLSRMANNGFKLEKSFSNGGKLYVHPDADKSKNDYKAIKRIGLAFAKLGHEVKITPREHYKSEEYKQIYGALIGTQYYKKCPDLSADNVFYEYEGFEKPWSKKKVSRMLSYGLVQSPRVVIDNTNRCSDRFIRKAVMARKNLKNNKLEEVWIYEKGNIRLFYKGNEFYYH